MPFRCHRSSIMMLRCGAMLSTLSRTALGQPLGAGLVGLCGDGWSQRQRL